MTEGRTFPEGSEAQSPSDPIGRWRVGPRTLVLPYSTTARPSIELLNRLDGWVGVSAPGGQFGALRSDTTLTSGEVDADNRTVDGPGGRLTSRPATPSNGLAAPDS